jgi:DNA repair protein RadD
MAFELREYQQAAIDALLDYWSKNGGNGLIVLPTGSGKSLVIAGLCQRLLNEFPTMRIGIITHIRELIAQDYGELIALWPEAPAGIYSAGMQRRDTRHKILFMGIQSVFRRAGQLGEFDLLLIDEAHLVSHNADTMYRKFFDVQRAMVPDLRIAGLTATAFRLDTGQLHKGFDKIFDDIVYDANVKTLIEEDWLCRLISKATVQKLDVSKVGKRGGEFITSELEEAVDQEDITTAAVKEIIGFSEGRKAWLVFCITVGHGMHVCEELRRQGVDAEQVYGITPKDDRDRIISDFRQGKFKALVSVMVLGTGFNVPGVDLIALLRPTASPGLFMQQVGRGLRKAPGKENCLVLDFAGNTRRHGPIDLVGSDKVADCIECPECHSLMIETAKKCPDCGYEWPVEEREKESSEPQQKTMHEAKADEKVEMLSTAQTPWLTVESVTFSVHHKWNNPDAPPTMRVDYFCENYQRYSEWICLAHPPGSYPRQKAIDWWVRHGGPLNVQTLQAAVDLGNKGRLRQPIKIMVKPDGRFFKIVGRQFEPVPAAAIPTAQRAVSA